MNFEIDVGSIDNFRDELVQLLRKHRVTISRNKYCNSWFFEKPSTEEMLGMNEVKNELSVSRVNFCTDSRLFTSNFSTSQS